MRPSSNPTWREAVRPVCEAALGGSDGLQFWLLPASSSPCRFESALLIHLVATGNDLLQTVLCHIRLPKSPFFCHKDFIFSTRTTGTRRCDFVRVRPVCSEKRCNTSCSTSGASGAVNLTFDLSGYRTK